MGANESGGAPDRGPPSGKSRVVINPIQTRLADWLHAQRRRTTRLVALTSTVRGPWPKSVAEAYDRHLRDLTPREWPRWRGFLCSAIVPFVASPLRQGQLMRRT